MGLTTLLTHVLGDDTFSKVLPALCPSSGCRMSAILRGSETLVMLSLVLTSLQVQHPVRHACMRPWARAQHL